MNNLCLTLSGSRRGHAPVQLSVSRPNGLIQASTVEPRLLGKNFLTLDVDCLIAQLSSSRTKPMARIVMQMPWLDYYSFYSLRHFLTDLRGGAHCVYNINIHLVLVVAYRRKAITRAILSTIQEVLHRILDRLEIRILDFSGEADHIRLAMRFPILSTASKRRPVEPFAKNMPMPLLHFFGEIASGPIATALSL